MGGGGGYSHTEVINPIDKQIIIFLANKEAFWNNKQCTSGINKALQLHWPDG